MSCPGSVLSGKVIVRETTCPGNVLSGKRLSGKVIVRETFVKRPIHVYKRNLYLSTRYSFRGVEFRVV